MTVGCRITVDGNPVPHEEVILAELGFGQERFRGSLEVVLEMDIAVCIRLLHDVGPEILRELRADVEAFGGEDLEWWKAMGYPDLSGILAAAEPWPALFVEDHLAEDLINAGRRRARSAGAALGDPRYVVTTIDEVRVGDGRVAIAATARAVKTSE